MRRMGWPEMVVNSSAPNRSGSLLSEPATVPSSHLRRSASTRFWSGVISLERTLRAAPVRSPLFVLRARFLPSGFDTVSTILNHSFVTQLSTHGHHHISPLYTLYGPIW